MITDKKEQNTLTIGNVALKSRVTLAPMAGITDYVYREIVRGFSQNALLTTEMISSEALVNNPKGEILFTKPDVDVPIAFQLSGHKPQIMAKAATIIEDKASIVDINMGCPVNKIIRGGDGSALMGTPKLASEIVKAVKESVNVPVTVKFRLGLTADTKNFVEFGELMQKSGASAITIHARTRSQMYGGKADWKAITALKSAVDVPVIANGDVLTVQDAINCIEVSGADAVAIGRGSIGNPFLFRHIEHYFKTGEILSAPSLTEKITTLKLHLDKEIAFRGEEFGIKFMRKFYAYYISSIKNAAKYRFLLVREEDYSTIIAILNEIETLSND